MAGAGRWAGATAKMLEAFPSPFAGANPSPVMASALEVFAHAVEVRGKPAFGLTSTVVNGKTLPVTEAIEARKPFGQLKHFIHAGATHILQHHHLRQRLRNVHGFINFWREKYGFCTTKSLLVAITIAYAYVTLQSSRNRPDSHQNTTCIWPNLTKIGWKHAQHCRNPVPCIHHVSLSPGVTLKSSKKRVHTYQQHSRHRAELDKIRVESNPT